MTQIIETLFIGDVIDKDRTMSIPDVIRDNGSVFLLSSGIPQLQFVDNFIIGQVPRDQVDSDSLLNQHEKYLDVLLEAVFGESVDN